MKFTRFGVLSPQKQVSYGKDSFHAAPTKKGIYAFPHPYVDKFLLGATDNPTNSSYKSYWLKDDDGNLILDEDISTYDYDTNKYVYDKEFKKLLKRRKIKESDLSYININRKSVFIVLKKPHNFDYNGMIWHHLYDALKMSPMSGEWIKTDMKTYKEALIIERHRLKIDYLKDARKNNWLDYDSYDWIKGRDGLNLYSKDSLEVFIEKIK